MTDTRTPQERYDATYGIDEDMTVRVCLKDLRELEERLRHAENRVTELLKSNTQKELERRERITLNQWRDRAHATAVEKGWYDEQRSIPELLMLIVSELSEALEDYRTDTMDTIVSRSGKPIGFGSEIADVLIRLFDLAGAKQLFGGEPLDLDALVAQKMAFNSTREHRHGGKRC